MKAKSREEKMFFEEKIFLLRGPGCLIFPAYHSYRNWAILHVWDFWLLQKINCYFFKGIGKLDISPTQIQSIFQQILRHDKKKFTTQQNTLLNHMLLFEFHMITILAWENYHIQENILVTPVQTEMLKSI